MLTNLKRILGFAVNDFNRNKGISVAAIFVLIVMIMLVSGLLFFRGITSYLTSEIKNKIDITAYFVDGTAEADDLGVRDEIIETTPNIKNIEYVSESDALEDFNKKHQNNPVLAKALQEVGGNPFLPSLNITTNGDPLQYEQVANILQTSDFSKLIDKVDFSQKEDTIKKIYSITTNINSVGIFLSIVLTILGIMVVFNTIKLAIDNSKEEIGTMRVVGASDWFIRGPFIICGAIYGFIAFVLCFLISGALAYLLSSYAGALLPGFSLIGYFLTNWWIFVLIQLFFGIGVGVISSFVVVKKYLEI